MKSLPICLQIFNSLLYDPLCSFSSSREQLHWVTNKQRVSHSLMRRGSSEADPQVISKGKGGSPKSEFFHSFATAVSTKEKT